jgi:hypothetical protein
VLYSFTTCETSARDYWLEIQLLHCKIWFIDMSVWEEAVTGDVQLQRNCGSLCASLCINSAAMAVRQSLRLKYFDACVQIEEEFSSGGEAEREIERRVVNDV